MSNDLRAPVNFRAKLFVNVCDQCGSTNVREWKPFGGPPRGNCKDCQHTGPFQTVQFVRLDAVKALIDELGGFRSPYRFNQCRNKFIAHVEGGAHDHPCDACGEMTVCGGAQCVSDGKSLFLCPDCFNNDLPKDDGSPVFHGDDDGKKMLAAARASGLPANSTRCELVTWLFENDRNGDYAQDEFTIWEAWYAVGCVMGVYHD